MKVGSLFLLLIVNALLRFVSVRWSGVRIGRGSWIKSPTEIGYGTGIGWCFTARGSGTLKIGKYCAVGEGVRVITSNHSTDYLAVNFVLQDMLLGERFVDKRSGVLIGSDVWIGDGVVILPGVTVGDGAVIGTGSIVTRSVAPYAVVAGNPARVIRSRFGEEIVAELLRLKWWDWPLEEIRLKKDMFKKNLNGNEP
jgi:virginiamycin A acetyltransferase